MQRVLRLGENQRDGGETKTLTKSRRLPPRDNQRSDDKYEERQGMTRLQELASDNDSGGKRIKRTEEVIEDALRTEDKSPEEE